MTLHGGTAVGAALRAGVLTAQLALLTVVTMQNTVWSVGDQMALL